MKPAEPTADPPGFVLAAEVARLLTNALGTAIRTTREADFIRVEADVPAKTTAEQYATVLAALGLADSYGHDRSETAEPVWALIPA